MSEYVQGSQAWLDKRKKKVTASEVPIILGISPYSTPRELWMQKKGLSIQKETWAMSYGSRNESVVRDRFVEMTGHGIEPGIADHKSIKWLMASLDGITFNKDIICEIKSNKKEFHEDAKKGKIPEFHWMQVQMQMECADVDECYYVSDNSGETIYTIIKRDKEWFNSVVETLKDFHDSLNYEIQPELSDKDIVENNDEIWSLFMQEARLNSDEIKRLTKRNDYLKSELVKMSGDRTTHGCCGTLRKKFKKGVIDYKAIDELKSIDIEKYRKKSSEYWTLEYDK